MEVEGAGAQVADQDDVGVPPQVGAAAPVLGTTLEEATQRPPSEPSAHTAALELVVRATAAELAAAKASH